MIKFYIKLKQNRNFKYNEMEPVLNYPFIKHLHEHLGIFILYIVNVTDEILNNMLTRCSHFLSDSSAFWSKKSPIFSTFWVISTHGTIFIEVNNSDKGCAFLQNEVPSGMIDRWEMLVRRQESNKRRFYWNAHKIDILLFRIF